MVPSLFGWFCSGRFSGRLYESKRMAALVNTMGRTYRNWSWVICFGMAVAQRHFAFGLNLIPILTIGMTALSIGFASMIGWLVTTPPTKLHRILGSSWLSLPGKFSYAMYIFHATVIVLLLPKFGVVFDQNGKWAMPTLNAIGFAIVVWVVTFGIAIASWYSYEMWFLKLKRFFPTERRAIGEEFLKVKTGILTDARE